MFNESESTQIKKLIVGIDLGNLKPSQLLKNQNPGEEKSLIDIFYNENSIQYGGTAVGKESF